MKEIHYISPEEEEEMYQRKRQEYESMYENVFGEYISKIEPVEKNLNLMHRITIIPVFGILLRYLLSKDYQELRDEYSKIYECYTEKLENLKDQISKCREEVRSQVRFNNSEYLHRVDGRWFCLHIGSKLYCPKPYETITNCLHCEYFDKYHTK